MIRGVDLPGCALVCPPSLLYCENLLTPVVRNRSVTSERDLFPRRSATDDHTDLLARSPGQL